MNYLLKLLNFTPFFTPCHKSCLWSTNHALKAKIMLYVAFWYHRLASFLCFPAESVHVLSYLIKKCDAYLVRFL